MSQYDRAYDPDYFQNTLVELLPLLGDYLRDSKAARDKVLKQKSIDEILADLDFNRLIGDGGADLALLVNIVLKNCNHMLDPRYIGHQVAVPMMPAVFADLLNGICNNAMPVYEMGPAPTAVERGVIDWMLAKTGWNRQGDGVLTHGGSLANLTCLLAARARALPDSWESGVDKNAVIMASGACHYSIAKAAAIMGLGTGAVREVPVDECNRIRIAELGPVYENLLKKKKEVIALVVNCCVTATGVYDPIREAARFCAKHSIWLHVDGAHGASVLMSPQFNHLMDGIELADSLTWDTHKMLGTAALCGAALFKNKQSLNKTFSQHGTYLFTEADKPGMDISERTIECTKSMMALKLFFNLAVLGEKGMAEHIDTLYKNTREFYELINARDGFSCLCPPEANVLCFSYGDDSQLQDRIRQQLVNEGDFYITRATVHGRSYLRLSVMNPLTGKKEINALCERIREAAEEMKKTSHK